ncbi:MAG: alpha-glucan family phosphorylase, partial [Dehalococcoidia bacterium]|nr:alpha-glucan family phosphorylase [Dehalococcoidia bacterium]
VGGRGLAAATEEDLDAVEAQCVFTTHTPVPAGHDRFEPTVVTQVLGQDIAAFLARCGGGPDGSLDMTALALFFSRYVNGVAMRHGEVSQLMFPQHTIRAITNGVHAATWIAPPFAALFDRHIPEWRRDNLYLRYAMGIPVHEIERAHALAKQALLEDVAARTGTRLDSAALTLGFARRATPYKRAALLFTDQDRLRAIARYVGPVQILYAGKAHPDDHDGKALIQRIVSASGALGDAVRVLYLENYDMTLAQKLCAGVDLWVNTPLPPQEASGTSGMKAAMNGVPSFSVLDGWWIEGHLEGVTGWAIGDRGQPSSDAAAAGALYDKLEKVIAPLFYARPSAYAEIMRACIAVNGAFFNTQRMVAQYVANAYFPAGE